MNSVQMLQQEPPYPRARTASGAEQSVADPQRIILRSTAVMSLVAIGLIHALDSISKFNETRYIFWMYIALIVGALATAGFLIERDSRLAWLAAGLLPLFTMAGYTMSRTIGLPGSTADVGNWSEPLGLASLFIEGCLVLVSLYGLVALNYDSSIGPPAAHAQDSR
ncbi:MAG: hypothetical protein NVSMB22_21590 [Chloroflexota bacterium]